MVVEHKKTKKASKNTKRRKRVRSRKTWTGKTLFLTIREVEELRPTVSASGKRG